VVNSRRIRSSALALVIAIGSLLAVAPQAPVAASSLPDCRYDDLLASPRAYSDWPITLVDTIYKVPKSYQPPGLVSTSKAGLKGGGYVRKIIIADLTAMARAARKAGAGLRVVSAYRSYRTQKRLFSRELERYGKKIALRSVARAGHSEHQLGTTIDFGAASTSGGADQKFAYTAAGKWMHKNAWKYGFVLSYPKYRTSKTCYYYEPWHYRYFGRTLAAKIHDSGLTTRQYLWRHYH
jgi:D-alanyl-D-alanine carboxypeptidase